MGDDFVVYTALIDGYDNLAAPDPALVEGLRLVCFTNTPGSVEGGWEVLPPDQRALAAVQPPPETAGAARPARSISARISRWHKAMAHLLFPAAKCSLWVDANQVFKADPRSIMGNLDAEVMRSRNTVATYKHYYCNNIHDELVACLAWRKDQAQAMINQVIRYWTERKSAVPQRHYETTILLRAHTPRVEAFNERWWREIDRGSFRDQLSFVYAMEAVGLACDVIPGRREGSPYFSSRKHHRP